MKRYLLIGALVAASPGLAWAQNYASDAFGPEAGDYEFTISGSGTSEQDLEQGTFSTNAELGWYLTDQLEVGIRQGLSWSGVEDGDDLWSGSTRGFVDYHFGEARLRPLVGASLGYAYGDTVNETFFAGLEAGLKYYVLPHTFVLGRAEYQFYFDEAEGADEAFENGAFVYTLGIGYNF